MKVFKIFICLPLIAVFSVSGDVNNCSLINSSIKPCQCSESDDNKLEILCKDVTEFADNNNNTIVDFGAGLTVQLSIHRLYIQNTSIERIESNAFRRFFIDETYFRNNAFLEYIDKNAFAGNEVKTLDVDYNAKLSQEIIFDLTSNLMPTEEIVIFANNIHSLPANAFDSNSKVKYVFLYANNIEILPNNDVFKSLINLRYLDISYNKITKIDALVFDSPLNLRIDLRHNMLTEHSFANTTISMLSKDVTIDLSENHFTTLPRHSFEHLVNGTRNKLIFKFYDTVNQFQCDSRMKWVQSYRSNFDDIWCANLNQSLFDVKSLVTAEPCVGFPENIGCVCIRETLNIRCDNNTALSRVNLKRIGDYFNDFNLSFDSLHIRNTSIDVLETNAFGINTKFAHIYIFDNQFLTAIHSNAFNTQSTISLFIENNPVLSVGLLELVSTNSSQLKFINFNKNKLQRIPEKSFHRGMLSNVEVLSVEQQNVDELVIEKNAFGLLPNLKGLSIENRNLQLTENAVNLSITENPLGFVSVFARNSSITNWNSKFIIQPQSTEMAVYLELQDNPINIWDNLTIFEQFNDFFSHHQRNKLFFTYTNRVCDCHVAIQLLILNANYTRLNGLHCTNIDLCSTAK